MKVSEYTKGVMRKLHRNGGTPAEIARLYQIPVAEVAALLAADDAKGNNPRERVGPEFLEPMF